MSEENVTDASASSPAPTSEGTPTEDAAQLKARIDELERAQKGMLRDLQSEREKRQALEAQAQSSPAPAGQSGPASDDPVKDVIQPYLKPYEQEIQILKQQQEISRAVKYIAKQEKLDEDEVINSSQFKELVEVAKRYNLRGMSPLDEAKAAYKLREAEKRSKEEAEKLAETQREAAISSGATVSTGQPLVNKAVKSFTRAEIGAMTLDEYKANREAIQAAQKAGLVK